MERLTDKDVGGHPVCKKEVAATCNARCGECDYDYECFKKLAYYEDLEEQGLLLKLPFKVGDTVWTPLSMSGWYLRKSDSPYKAKVVFIGLNDSREMGGGLFNVVYENRGHMMQFNFSDIGKTVFTSKEEVEKAFTKKVKDYD